MYVEFYQQKRETHLLSTVVATDNIVHLSSSFFFLKEKGSGRKDLQVSPYLLEKVLPRKVLFLIHEFAFSCVCSVCRHREEGGFLKKSREEKRKVQLH